MCARIKMHFYDQQQQQHLSSILNKEKIEATINLNVIYDRVKKRCILLSHSRVSQLDFGFRVKCFFFSLFANETLFLCNSCHVLRKKKWFWTGNKAIESRFFYMCKTSAEHTFCGSHFQIFLLQVEKSGKIHLKKINLVNNKLASCCNTD